MSLRISLLVLGLALGCPTWAAAADPAAAPVDTLAPGPWKLGAIVGLNVTQSSYTSNWAGGDRGSMAWVVSTNFTANRQFTRVYNAKNRLMLAYGQTAQQVPSENDATRLVWDTPVKSSDQILFAHTSRFTLGGFVDPYFGLDAESQFRDLSNPVGEISFNPIKLKEAAGIARVLGKTEKSEWITRLGFGFRQTFGRSFVAPPSMEKESFASNDGGFEWQTTAKQPVLDERVLYEGGLLVFAPVFYSKSGDLESFDELARAAYPGRGAVADYWRTPDVTLLNSFTTHVTKLITVNLLLHFVYDKFDTKANVNPDLPLDVQISEIDRNIRKSGQFKEVLALGISYSFL